uniref:Large ribosomal subunit protein eL36 n=1 Tax=Gopherus agassizii TaxID=38772 RepID=A0A452GMP0_9SAUR
IAERAAFYAMAVGLNTAHKVAKKVSEPRQSHRRDHLTKHTQFIRDKICKVSGFRACEKRVASCTRCIPRRGCSGALQPFCTREFTTSTQRIITNLAPFTCK